MKNIFISKCMIDLFFFFQTCELLMDHTMLKESLGMFARTKDPMLQKVVAKIIFFMLEPKDLRSVAQTL